MCLLLEESFWIVSLTKTFFCFTQPPPQFPLRLFLGKVRKKRPCSGRKRKTRLLLFNSAQIQAHSRSERRRRRNRRNHSFSELLLLLLLRGAVLPPMAIHQPSRLEPATTQRWKPQRPPLPQLLRSFLGLTRGKRVMRHPQIQRSHPARHPFWGRPTLLARSAGDCFLIIIIIVAVIINRVFSSVPPNNPKRPREDCLVHPRGKREGFFLDNSGIPNRTN